MVHTIAPFSAKAPKIVGKLALHILREGGGGEGGVFGVQRDNCACVTTCTVNDVICTLLVDKCSQWKIISL